MRYWSRTTPCPLPNASVPSEDSTDVLISQLAGRSFYERLLRAGVEIYEYQPQILHSKLFIVDDQVYVGSANLDRRGMFLNYELLLLLGDREVVGEAGRSFAQALQHCRRIERKSWHRSRGWWTRWQERWACFIVARLDPIVAHRQLANLRKPR